MLARKSLLMISSLLLTNIFGFVSWYFITNNILQEYVGSIGWAISFLGLVGFFIDFGFSTAHIKKVSEGKDIGKCIGTYATVKTVLLMLLIIVVFVSIELYKIIPGVGFKGSYDEDIIKIMLVWMLLSGLSTIALNTFVGRQEIAKSQLPLMVGAIVQSLVTIYIVLNYNDVYLYAVTYIIGSSLTLYVSFLLMKDYSIKLPSWKLFKEYFKFALPLMLSYGAAPIILFLDKVMLGIFWENSDVSIYWNAQKYAMLPDMMTATFITVLFPAFSALIAKGSISKVKSITLEAEKYISMVTFPAAFILMALSVPFIEIVSDKTYSDSALVFSILMGWVILRALNRPYVSHFAAFNKTIYPMIITILNIPINTILNLIFIPESIYGVKLLGMGPSGAALATLISIFIQFFVVRYLSRKLIKVPINWCVPKHIVSAAIPTLLIYLFQLEVAGIHRWYEVIGIGIIGVAIYLGILILFKEFGKKDLDMIIDTIDAKKMFRYLKEEIFGRGG